VTYEYFNNHFMQQQCVCGGISSAWNHRPTNGLGPQ